MRIAARLIAAGSVLALSVPLGQAGAGAAGSASTTLTLSSQPDWVNPGQPFPVRITVGPARGRAVADGSELEVSVYERLLTRSAFALSQAGRDLGEALWSDTIALGPGGAGGPTAVCIPVDTAPSPACDAPYALHTGDTPGVYPVEITVRDAVTGLAEARLVTHLLLLAPGVASNPLRVALVIPEAAPTPLGTDGARRVSTADAARLDQLATVLTGGVTDTRGADGLTVAPDPGTLAALADTPTTSARNALSAIRRLSGDAQSLAQTFAPVDPVDLVDAGLDSELRSQLARGGDVDSAELGQRPGPATGLVQGPLDRPTLTSLAGLGTTHLVVPAGDVSGGQARLTPDRPYPLAVGSTTVQSLSGDVGLAHDLQLSDTALGTHELLADLAQVYFENPNLEYYQAGRLVPQPRVVVAESPRYWSPTREAATDLVQALTTSPFLAGVTLDQAFSQVPASTEPATPAGTAGRRQNVEPARVHALRASLASLSASLVRPVPAILAAGDLILTSESAGLSPTRRGAYLAAAQSRVQGELGQVTVVSSGITLTARQAKIPLSIVSNLPVPVRVTVILSSTRLEFQGGARDSISQSFTLRLRNTTWLVPVVARTTGSFQVGIRVVTAQGGQPMSSTHIYINSQAFSGVGIFLSAAALLGLAFWWGRALQKGRRNRRLVNRDE